MRAPNACEFCNSVREMLRSITFLGTYEERRYVESLHQYMDVIVLDKVEEKFGKELQMIRNGIKLMNKNYFTGIIQNGINCEILTQFQHLETLGHHMFVIEDVIFGDNSAKFIVKTQIKQLPLQSQIVEESDILPIETVAFAWESIVGKTTRIWIAMEELITMDNITSSVRFLSIFLTAMAVGSYQLAVSACDFFIKFMEKSAQLVTAMTPALLGLMDMMSKIVGGFYLLIAMMFGKPPVGRDETFYTPYRPNNNQSKPRAIEQRAKFADYSSTRKYPQY